MRWSTTSGQVNEGSIAMNGAVDTSSVPRAPPRDATLATTRDVPRSLVAPAVAYQRGRAPGVRRLARFVRVAARWYDESTRNVRGPEGRGNPEVPRSFCLPREREVGTS